MAQHGIGGAKGNRPPPPRDLSREGYAGAHAALSAPNAEWHSSAIDSGRHEQEFIKAKTKSDARKMVANMVAERLALCGMSTGAGSESVQQLRHSTPARNGGNGTAAYGSASPMALADGLRTPAAYVEPPPPPPPPPAASNPVEAAAALASAVGASTFYRKPAVNAIVNAAVSQAVSHQHQQSSQQQQSKPAWRHAGNAPPPKPPSPSTSNPYRGPRAWHTREELVVCVEEATRRAEAAESAAEGARLACEMLKEEVGRAEAKEQEALAAATAAKAHSLTVGENEVRLRVMLEESHM